MQKSNNRARNFENIPDRSFVQLMKKGLKTSSLTQTKKSLSSYSNSPIIFNSLLAYVSSDLSTFCQLINECHPMLASIPTN